MMSLPHIQCVHSKQLQISNRRGSSSYCTRLYLDLDSLRLVYYYKFIFQIVLLVVVVVGAPTI